MTGTILCFKCASPLTHDQNTISTNGGALCITCGFVDYSFPEEKKPLGSSEGLVYIVKYYGKQPVFKTKLIKAKIIRSSWNQFEATCPFCEDTVWVQNSVPVKKKCSVRMYQCPDSHRFYLRVDNESQNFDFGWE